MAWGKKKKTTEEELRAKLAELEREKLENQEIEADEELPTETPPKPPKKLLKKKEEEPIGEFSLSEEEMALAVNALAQSEEFKVYRQMVVGQRIAEIIDGYNKVVSGKDEEQESELP